MPPALLSQYPFRHKCVVVLCFLPTQVPFLCGCSPYIPARYSPLQSGGEEGGASPVTPGENQPAEAADGR